MTNAFDYAFPRELYENEEEWREQGFFQRHPDLLEQEEDK